MGDEYDYAEAAYWENAEEYEAELEQYRTYSGGIQFPTASPAVTGVGITQPAGWAIRKKVKETEVRQSQDLLTEAEELRAKAAELENIAAEREKYGADPFKNGDVLKVDMRYRTGSRRSFAYGVIKVAGRFYLSGKLGQPSSVAAGLGWDWEQFVAWLSQGDATVWQAKSLRQVL